MSHLLSTYAAASGLKIDEVDVKSSFYPLPFDSFITLQANSGQVAKNYDYWQEVVILLKPILDKHKIEIVYLGGKDDPIIKGVHDLRGKTTFIQSHYIIKNSLLHMGNDSWLAHCAGWNSKPLVALYGSTSVNHHGPYFYNTDKSIFLSSHRFGGIPTYSSNENPKTINFIPPEDVANSVLKLILPDEAKISFKTRLFGLIYNHVIWELAPDSVPPPSFVTEAVFSVRMDYIFNEDILLNVLRTGRKVSIVTNKPINLNILAQFRQSIINYTHEINLDCPIQYVSNLKNVVQNHSFFTKEQDEKKLANLRFHFFDVCSIEKVNDVTKEDYIKAALVYLNWKEDKRLDIISELDHTNGKLRFKSNKYLLSGGHLFLSRAHWKAKIGVTSTTDNSGDVINNDDFFSDINHMTIFWQPK